MKWFLNLLLQGDKEKPKKEPSKKEKIGQVSTKKCNKFTDNKNILLPLSKIKDVKSKYLKKIKNIIIAMSKCNILKNMSLCKNKRGGFNMIFGNKHSVNLKELLIMLFSKSIKKPKLPYFLKIKLHKLKIQDPKSFYSNLSKLARNEIKQNYP